MPPESLFWLSDVGNMKLQGGTPLLMMQVIISRLRQCGISPKQKNLFYYYLFKGKTFKQVFFCLFLKKFSKEPSKQCNVALLFILVLNALF